jgi:hypothetical protein
MAEARASVNRMRKRDSFFMMHSPPGKRWMKIIGENVLLRFPCPKIETRGTRMVT